MALSVGNIILASDFINLKNRVKAECARRKYIGSVEQYSGAAYDYTVIPSPGNPVLAEHYNKIVIPMNAILDTGYSEKAKGDAIPELATLSSILSTLEAEGDDENISSCRASCTGLCKGSCAGLCTGCSGGCASTCSSGCSGGCSSCTSCTGSCTGCTSCVGGCSGTCTSSCKGYCRLYCTGQNRDPHP